MYTCIYCLETGSAGFSRQEHVIPQSFGRFDSRNPVLNYRVCKRCNKDLGAELDEWLAKDSIEGFLRQLYLKVDEYQSKGGDSRAEYTVIGGEYDGSRAYMVPGTNGKPVPKPFRQAGFERLGDKGRDWYRVADLPKCDDYSREKYRCTGENFVLAIGDEQVQTMERLRDLGWPAATGKEYAPLETQLEIRSLYCIDGRHMRAITKIAYGFAAFCLGSQVPGPRFEDARRYVLTGQGPNPVEIRQHLQLSDRDSKQVAYAHFLGIRICPASQDLVVEVSLLNHLTYRVTVAKKYLSTPRFEPHALAFNLQDKSISRFEYATTGEGPWSEFGANGLQRIHRV